MSSGTTLFVVCRLWFIRAAQQLRTSGNLVRAVKSKMVLGRIRMSGTVDLTYDVLIKPYNDPTALRATREETCKAKGDVLKY